MIPNTTKNHFQLISDKLKYINIYDLKRAHRFARTQLQNNNLSPDIANNSVELISLLVNLKPDPATLIAALLHDAIYLTNIDLGVIEKKFGKSVARLSKLLLGLDKLNATDDISNSENLRRMFLTMAEDLRVVIIKLADKLHQLIHIDELENLESQKKLANQVMDVYVPVAARLGVYSLKRKLEDLSFEFLDSKNFKSIDDQLNEYAKKREKTVKQFITDINVILSSNNISAKVIGRVKNHYSIYKKFKKKNRNNINEIYDIIALRVVISNKSKQEVDTISEAYKVLGLIHNQYTPISNRFKDYIASPKSNGYQCLHTTIKPQKASTHPIEIQIRTEEMDKVAEYGLASHWLYQERKGKNESSAFQLSDREKQNLKLFLKSDNNAEKEKWNENYEWVKKVNQKSSNIIQNQTLNLFQNRIYVMSPQGEIIELDADSTPVDYAFKIHPKLGYHTASAHVNGKLVPLSHILKTGDLVKINEKKSAKPRQYWLTFCKTGYAKEQILEWFQTEESSNESLLIKGRTILNRELKKKGLLPLDQNLKLLNLVISQKATIEEKETILIDIGNGNIEAKELVNRIISKQEENIARVKKRSLEKANLSQVIVGGQKNLPIKFPKCCEAKYPNFIVGYIGKDKKIAVHQATCKVLQTINKDRLIDTEWLNDKSNIEIVTDKPVVIKFDIHATNRKGLINDITSILFNAEANILNFDLINKTESRIHRSIVVEMGSYSGIPKLVKEIKNVSGLEKVDLYKS